jgi:hypothetical protein
MEPQPILLRWSDYVPASDIQDPLGLGLRGSARLASELLYCITSITPRARYFSFLAWCVHDFRLHEKGKLHATGLRPAITLREHALTAGCVVHHQGDVCVGGGLVGSRGARKWFGHGAKELNLKKMKPFAKNPALDAYLASLVNLRFFNMTRELPDTDEATTDDTLSFDDLELSALGAALAKQYDAAVGRLSAVKHFSTGERSCSASSLAEFGKRGGLCELSDTSAPDRSLLRDIFLNEVRTEGRSHSVRRQSLLLLLELTRQLSAKGLSLDETTFASSVYYGECFTGTSARLKISIPPPLADITRRWRMFYFHHFMAVALEGVFSWLVSNLGPQGLAGSTLDALVGTLAEPRLRRDLKGILGVDLPRAFSDLTPSALLSQAGLPSGPLDSTLATTLDQLIRTSGPFSEDSLEELLRGNKYLYSATGLALPLVLLAVTLGRYAQWETTNYGHWLAGIATDPYLDLVPPLVASGLARTFPDWWHSPFGPTAAFIISRYVVRQHLAMSYEKTATGDRCLLQTDGTKVFSTGAYDKIGLTNARLTSALQILLDLALLTHDRNDAIRLTSDGQKVLERALAKEAQHQVS